MPTTVLADRDRAARRHYVTTVLAERLVDRLDELERQVQDGPLDRARLRGQADDALHLATAVHDELAELEP